MIRRISWWGAVLILAAGPLATVRGAETAPPPAPYVPLPAGTVLNYGTWHCTVESGGAFEHVCRGLRGEIAGFYGKLVSFGAIAPGGYGSGMDEIYCERPAWANVYTKTIKSIGLSAEDRAAIRALWPLAVGKEARFRRNFRPMDGSGRSVVRVAGARRVSVAGAERDVYVVEGKTTRIHCKNAANVPVWIGFDETWWYAPDIAAVVHYAIHWTGVPDVGQDFSYDLEQIRLPAGTVISAAPVVEAAPAAARPMAREGPPPSAPDAVKDIHFGRFHALVIGNNDYRHFRDLRMARADAEAVAALLAAEYGFAVTKLINATRADVIRGLAGMRATLKADDSLLIYYAGHGIVDEVGQVGYWLPVDAEDGIPTNWVSTADINVMLRTIRAKHIMVVADSCYSGTLVRSAPTTIRTAASRDAWIRRIVGKRSRTALVSGGLEPVLDAGGRGHSIFARAFLNALGENRGVMDGQMLFDALKRTVVLNADQTPQYSDIRRSGHEGGDFLFVRK